MGIVNKALRSIKDEFEAFLHDLIAPHSKRKSFFGALIMGRKRRSEEMPFLPPDVYDKNGELLINNEYRREAIIRQFVKNPDAFGASLVLSLDPVVFAKLTGRIRPYIAIPTTTGSTVLSLVAHYFVSKEGPINRMFETESGPDGPWPALSTRELQWRKAHGYPPGPILQASGVFKNTVVSMSLVEEIKGGKYARAILGPNKILSSSRVTADDHIIEKFYVHMLGTTDGFGRGIPIPPRPFMPRDEGDLTAKEQKDIAKLIKEGIELGKLDEKARIKRDIKGRFAK